MLNRVEWDIVNIANMFDSITTVALHHNWSISILNKVIKDNNIATIFVSASQVNMLLSEGITAKNLIVIDTLNI